MLLIPNDRGTAIVERETHDSDTKGGKDKFPCSLRIASPCVFYTFIFFLYIVICVVYYNNVVTPFNYFHVISSVLHNEIKEYINKKKKKMNEMQLCTS